MGSTATPTDGSVLESDDLRQMIGLEALNVLKCSICWEFYRDPVILACGHTFCYRCLLEMAKHAKANNTNRAPLHAIYFGCPNCRRPTYINSLLVRRVTHNYPLTSLIESLRQRQTVKKVSIETNTERVELPEFWPKNFNFGMDSKRKRQKQDHKERKFDLLTGNLDLVLRTLSANGTVLGDLSCAADIQQIVGEYQKRLERNYNAKCDSDVENEDIFATFKNVQESTDPVNSPNTMFRNNQENSPVREEPESKSSQTPLQSPFSSIFNQTKKAPSAFQDPAILSYSIDPPSPVEQFPSFGLFSFPGFGRM